VKQTGRMTRFLVVGVFLVGLLTCRPLGSPRHRPLAGARSFFDMSLEQLMEIEIVTTATNGRQAVTGKVG